MADGYQSNINRILVNICDSSEIFYGNANRISFYLTAVKSLDTAMKKALKKPLIEST